MLKKLLAFTIIMTSTLYSIASHALPAKVKVKLRASQYVKPIVKVKPTAKEKLETFHAMVKVACRSASTTGTRSIYTGIGKIDSEKVILYSAKEAGVDIDRAEIRNFLSECERGEWIDENKF